MKKVLREQLNQNPDKLKLLLNTGNINLIHKPKREDGTYYPDSIIIPGELFSRYLLELRYEFNNKNKVQEETVGKVIDII